MAVRLLLADDHNLVRAALRALLEREGYEVVAEAADGREAIGLARDLAPDVAILEVAMPVLNGFDAARQIQRLSPGTRTLLLTLHEEEQYLAEALQAGVRGFVLKTQVAGDLVQAIEQVASGAVYLSPQVSQLVVDDFLGRRRLGAERLTAREREVLQLIAEGRTTKETAAMLGVSLKTAESHRARIMKKLDVHEVTGLVRYAIRRGLVRP
jgi:DNA-binding NarL/FixJ family response regulator